MRIICRNQSCEHCMLGECSLTRVSAPGTGGDACIYFISKDSKESMRTLP